MKQVVSGGASAHVVIAGGGFAGLETLLALRTLGGDRARVTLVSPDPTFTYRPGATIDAFEDHEASTYDLRAIASDLGATYHRARLESVGARKRYVRLSSGAALGYDDLVLALGARANASIPGALTFRDQRDVPLFRGLLRRLADPGLRRLVFAIPGGDSWPLPMYELALLSAAYVARHGCATEITLVTPERTPLAAFGERSSSVVAGVLSRAGISFLGGSAGREVRHDGSLLLKSGNLVPADQVVAAPRLRGERITGVPADPSGFIPTDGVGRVLGLRGVYAAGDATTFPVKQAGLSTQQADRVAQAILGGDAASQAILGGDAASQSIVSGDAAGQRIPSGDAPAQATRTPRVLRARLLADQQPLFFTTELDDDGRVTSASVTSASRPGSIYTKVSARYLAPYLEGLRISREATLVAAS